jgi:hypothetical protein
MRSVVLESKMRAGPLARSSQGFEVRENPLSRSPRPSPGPLRARALSYRSTSSIFDLQPWRLADDLEQLLHEARPRIFAVIIDLAGKAPARVQFDSINRCYSVMVCPQGARK